MQDIKHLILDMDGVLWRGERPQPGLNAFIDTLRRLDIGFAFATNNASRRVDQYVAKFAGFGLTIEPWRILTSAEVTGVYAASQFAPGTPVYVVGDDGLKHAIRSRGLHLLNDDFTATDRRSFMTEISQMSAAAVFAGFTQRFTFVDGAAATYFITRGARFIGSNPDKSFPSEIGPLPGAGAILALIEAATGVTPEVIGKPKRPIFDEALRRLNATPATTAMVGDRLETDIDGGHAAGLRTILVLSGISTRDAAMASALPPAYIVDDIQALSAALEEAYATS